jgi:hypothetical protein
LIAKSQAVSFITPRLQTGDKKINPSFLLMEIASHFPYWREVLSQAWSMRISHSS